MHHVVKCSPLKNIFWLTFGLLSAHGWTNKLLLRLELRLRELINSRSGKHSLITPLKAATRKFSKGINTA